MTNYNTTNTRTINLSSATWTTNPRAPKTHPTAAVSQAVYYPPISIINSTTYYFMRAQDPNCLPTVTYRYWTVTGTPDTTGALYVGTRCGASPLTNITYSRVIV